MSCSYCEDCVVCGSELGKERDRYRQALQRVFDLTQRAVPGEHQRIGAEVCFIARRALAEGGEK